MYSIISCDYRLLPLGEARSQERRRQLKLEKKQRLIAASDRTTRSPVQNRIRNPQATVAAELPSGWNASNICLDRIDIATDAGIADLTNQFIAEHRTLATHRDELLKQANGQFVVIQGDRWSVKPTLDEAVAWGRSAFSRGLFFLGRISEIDFDQYLSGI